MYIKWFFSQITSAKWRIQNTRPVPHYIGTHKHFYDHLIEQRQIETNPTTAPTNQRDKVMLGLLIDQGLKTEELAKLEVQDVNLREGKIDVPGSRKSNGREMKLEAHQVMDMHQYTLQVSQSILEMPPKRKSRTPQQTDKLFIAQGGNTTSFGTGSLK